MCGEEQEEKAKQKQEEKENTDKIITTKVFPKEQRTTKLASWDLEASPDDTGSFRTWALGFAWFELAWLQALELARLLNRLWLWLRLWL